MNLASSQQVEKTEDVWFCHDVADLPRPLKCIVERLLEKITNLEAQVEFLAQHPTPKEPCNCPWCEKTYGKR